ncbi:Sucrose/H+ symporter, plant [Penicillium digitatum]|uniref:A-kinase anchor protein 7-like phosphoesterase domain-containing protein n=3 Tax=Penicillium digitatum TaxID=36651 RepID=K9FXN1_PEND2|nr:hypothetical protein PDIP_24760 [Penicillium digitatum Pd1]EKV13307.1 hypothetical protein PDIG_39190 [Penicillium digitatum PHI26]EKV19181.1 hypothetical protein PDIP_24760 [Penicillium digitatum Pd1]QQK42925.1 Sucrose/H+ symporter, plant [Penicillium digitatum]
MTEAAGISRHQSHKPRPEKRQKRPQLTHFLCLPLVNTKSLPQLELSLVAFKTAHLAEPGSPFQSTPNGQGATFSLGLPSTAFRPLGTLHLTLGVMSLTNKERLGQALAFFQSIDLAELMNEAERATHTQQRSALHPSSPLTISLESLHALPQVRSASILYASPIDPTGRLLPFCIKLRDKFIEAGFIQSESDRRPAGRQKPTIRFVQDCHQAFESGSSSIDVSSHSRESKTLSEPPGASRNPDPSITVRTRDPKPQPQPLLLHATLVNTIYVRGRQGQNKDSKSRTLPERLTFDARNLISQYCNYYSDDNQTIPHPAPAVSYENSKNHHSRAKSSPIPNKNIISSNHESYPDTPFPPFLPPSQGYPFIWAKEIPLDTICICEMGARKLHPVVNDNGLNERLGEKYTVVAERSLNP